VAAEHRGQGIGRHLVAAVEAVAVRRECAVVGATASSAGAAAALLRASGFQLGAAAGTVVEPRRWEHHLTAIGAEAGG
jgi:ribosomal protein S18 acetylase RimI-like enzyme